MDGLEPIEYSFKASVVINSTDTSKNETQEVTTQKEELKKPDKEIRSESKEINTSRVDMGEIVAQLNEVIKVFNTKITFSYDPRIERSVIVVTDSTTGEVIRKIPPEEMILLISKLREIAGLLYNKKVS
ncbi:MAG: flagellar protein FlaG [Candidatus Marinimicrobia bacterium]|nr:flagellar protein FlaG [Candidatus Neomarinimicrobiota bacterium]